MAVVLAIFGLWVTSLIASTVLTVRSMRDRTTLEGRPMGAIIASGVLVIPGVALLLEIVVRLALAPVVRPVEAFDYVAVGPATLWIPAGVVVLFWSLLRWPPWLPPRRHQATRAANVVAWVLSCIVALECAISI
jgi:predicted Kef-type K+ transport protein